MNGGIVKFHALSDPDRSGAQNHHLLLLAADSRFVLLSGIGGVKIGDIGVKLGSAGIDGLVDREELFLHPHLVHPLFRAVPEQRHRFVAKAVVFGLFENLRIKGSVGQFFLNLHNVGDFV